jgi:hypothetical protein
MTDSTLSLLFSSVVIACASAVLGALVAVARQAVAAYERRTFVEERRCEREGEMHALHLRRLEDETDRRGRQR